MPRPKIFISYSHKDENEKNHLLTHLSVLQKAAGIVEDVWHDARIQGGQEWKQEIERAMADATIAVLLISVHSLTSDYVLNVEVQRLLEQREKDGVIIYPILAKACYVADVEWLAKLQIRPKGLRPVWREGGRYADDELEAITAEIANIIKETQRQQAQAEQARIAALEAQRRASEEAEIERLANEQFEREQQAQRERQAYIQAEAARRVRERLEREQREREQRERERLQQELTLTLAPGVTLELVRVPAGEFWMGSGDDDKEAYDNEKPQHKIHLPDYLIGKYPVTVAQFAAFAQAKNYATTAEQRGSSYAYTASQWEDVKGANWQHPRGPKSDVRQKQNHPVTHISWDDAMAFCQWASQLTGRTVRLPSEAEWEKAARGPSTGSGFGRIYPWGDEAPNDKLCNFNMNVGDTTLVGQYSPQGDSPYGCVDMMGNVWEWTRSLWGKNSDKPDFKYPYRADDGREDLEADGLRVLRGGAFLSQQRLVRCAFRSGGLWFDHYGNDGFRIFCAPSF